jgi:uncharacterized protein (TIGR03435 family)
MAKSRQFGIILSAGFLLCAVCWTTSSGSLPAQTNPAPQAAATTKTLSYEIVSIRPDRSESRNGKYEYVPDGLNFINLPLRPLIDDAFDIAAGEGISGLPGWANSEPYDVQAKVDAAAAEAAQKLSLKELIVLQRPMLQSLLADRCQLKAHLETKTGPAYDLVIAKGGLKMKEAPADEEPGGMISTGSMTVHGQSLDWLVGNLAGWTGRKVVDKTGLAGKKFDFVLQWSPDGQSDAANAGPSIFSALEEQLGLKLAPSQEPMKILVIDHMERPSPN